MKRFIEAYRELFPARILSSALDTGTGQYHHAWIELTVAATDGYQEQAGARSGTTSTNYALELNNAQCPDNTLVWLRHRDEREQLHYEFDRPAAGGGGGGTITVAEIDGTPTIADVATLYFDQDSGLYLTTAGGAGTARVYIYQASATQVGIVATGTQTFAGQKTFTAAITAQGGLNCNLATSDAYFTGIVQVQNPSSSGSPYTAAGDASIRMGSGGFVGYVHADRSMLLRTLSGAIGPGQYCEARLIGNTAADPEFRVVGGAGLYPNLALNNGSATTYGATNSTGGLNFLKGLYTGGTITGGGGSGTVTSISAGTGITLTPSPIVATGTVALSIPVAVSSGGTGATAATAYAVQCGGTTGTAAHQSVAGTGTSGQVLTSSGAAALPTWQSLPAKTTEGYWRFDGTGTTAADPGNGKLRLNNSVVASATNLYISQFTDPGTDANLLLASLIVGDGIAVQDQDNSANQARFTIRLAPTDNGAWWTLPVTYVSGTGTAPPNNNRLLLVFSQAGGGGGVALAVAILPGGRLTAAGGTPVPTSDVGDVSTIYYSPYQHNQIQ